MKVDVEYPRKDPFTMELNEAAKRFKLDSADIAALKEGRVVWLYGVENEEEYGKIAIYKSEEE